MAEERKKSEWRGFAGWALLVAGVLERVVGLGGSIDFVISRSQDPGWLATAFRFAVHNFGLALILSGVAFIVWNERRRTTQLLEARLSAFSGPKAPTKREKANEPLLPMPLPQDDGIDEERIYLGSNVTPVFLIEQHEGKSILEGRESTKKYLGKWMKISGVLSNVLPVGDDRLWVILAVPRKLKIAGVEIPSSAEVRAEFYTDFEVLKTRRLGDILLIEGKLEQVLSGAIELEDCHLLKAATQDELKAEGPPPPPPPDTGEGKPQHGGANGTGSATRAGRVEGPE